MPHPTIIHHKGALDRAAHPPNTLGAVEASLQAGAAVVEIDIVPLADSDYLVLHDLALDHETNGTGRASEWPAARAAELRLHGGAAVPVARLSEIVALWQQTEASATLQLDFKHVFAFADDEPLQRLLRLIEPLGQRVIISSCADWHLRTLRRLSPEVALGFDPLFYLDKRHQPEAYPPQVPPFYAGAHGYHDDHLLARNGDLPVAAYLQDRCDALAHGVPDVRTLYVNYRTLLASLDDGFNWAGHLAARGIDTVAWTVDIGAVDDAVLGRLLAAGVTHITSNTPLALGARVAALADG